MDIKELRKELGMSQQRFGDKFGIPRRTIQDWESGAHKAPDYVLDMINKVIQFEKLAPMAWVFYEYRDKAGIGSSKTFTSNEEAANYAKNEWGHLSEADQQSYKEDPCGEYWVALVPMVWDEYDEKFYPDTSNYTPVWSAI